MSRRVSRSAPKPFDQVLLPDPSSVAAARGLVRELLDGAGRNDLLDDAVLLVSEIVTNALIHAGSSIRVRGRVDEQGIRVEVGDAGPHRPALRDYADAAGTGRGLALLVELVDDWGVVAEDVGKTVWFALGRGRSRGEAPSSDAAAPGGRPELFAQRAQHPAPVTERTGSGATLEVRLLTMPLLLHEAWREHAETLLRDHLLASLDFDTVAAKDSAAAGADPVQVHADAMDAMALLEEQVPVAEVGAEPARMLSEATEPGVTSPELWLRVPRTSVPHFATLERALEAAELVGSSHGLVPRTQPEIQAFRRWVCREVADQSIGKPATPWDMSLEPAEAPTTRSSQDIDDIGASSENLIAADDASHIVGVSASAAELLGYATAEDLVGRRLVTIIPTRFRQAHVAGFTLHHLVGRSRLLGREVEVPALRRDGTEIDIRLEITPRSTPDGAALFVARIGPAHG